MDVSVETVNPCRKVLSVKVGGDAVKPEYENVVRAFSANASVPGFRKGKVPKDIVEKRFSGEIAEETQERLKPVLYKQAIEKKGIDPVAVVGVSDVKFARDEGMSFKVTVDIAPEFRLPKYRKIALRKKKVIVTEEMVRDTIERLKQNMAEYHDITDRPVMKDDLVMIDFTGSIEGVPLKELDEKNSHIGEGKDFWVPLGENEILPGLGKQIIGMKQGEKKDVSIAFPEEFTVTSVAGKTADYSVTIRKIREKKIPDFNDDTLKQFEVGSVQELSGKIRSNMIQNLEEKENNRLKEEIVKYLLEKADIHVPESIVEEETKSIVYEIVRENMMRGVDRSVIDEKKEEIVDNASKSSRNRVKTSYILDRIADAEKITVDDAEVDKQVSEMAKMRKVPVERLKSEMEKRGDFERLKMARRAEKTLDYLLDQAKIKQEK